MGWGGGGRELGAAPAVCAAGGRSGSWTLQPQLRPGGSSARPSAEAGAAPSWVSPPGPRGSGERAESEAGEGGTQPGAGEINSSSERIRGDVLVSRHSHYRFDPWKLVYALGVEACCKQDSADRESDSIKRFLLRVRPSPSEKENPGC